MKRLATYYFLLHGGVNVLFAQFMPHAVAYYESVIGKQVLEGQALPAWSEFVFQYSLWWFWICVTVCVVGATLSLLGRPKDNVLKNLLILFLIFEHFIMFSIIVAFVLPLVRL